MSEVEVEFVEFPKIPRLSRECIVTEKIDGTSGQVYVCDVDGSQRAYPPSVARIDNLIVCAGSRNRFLSVEADKFGFAKWVAENARELAQLGPGRHFGEWWGSGVQRGYGLPKGEKRWSLFNVSRWNEVGAPPFESKSLDPRQPSKFSTDAPACCHVVPVLYRGSFDTAMIEGALTLLGAAGSKAAPGFDHPEGVVVFHVASGTLFKRTLDRDGEPKGAAR